jgi:hypothetical protein
MAACGGWVDRNEFDLFLSRLRVASEIDWAVTGIQEYRTLDSTEQDALLSEVRGRIDSAKKYQNWRDTGLHTFTLFSLGLSAVRAEQRLILAGAYLEDLPEHGEVPGERPRKARARVKSVTSAQRSLKIPEPAAGDELSVPPTTPAANSWTDAETLVGKILQANGWTVVYYSNRRGYGFDIWARKGLAALLVEVKSALSALGAIVLTRTEFEAAQYHGLNYVIATVENIGSDRPLVRFISDPADRLRVEPRSVEVYAIARDEWEPAANESYDS